MKVLENNLQNKNIKLRKLETEVKVLKEKLKEKGEQVKNLKSCALYQKLRRKTLYLNQKEGNMKAQLLKCSDREKKMRKKVKGFQRKLRVQKTKVAQLANRKKDALCQLASIKRDLVK